MSEFRYTGWDDRVHPPTCQHDAIIGDCNTCAKAYKASVHITFTKHRGYSEARRLGEIGNVSMIDIAIKSCNDPDFAPDSDGLCQCHHCVTYRRWEDRDVKPDVSV